jgi:anthranilate synthase/aminodeoxychorismate synthase-like glutamine amidotransferase
MTVSLDSLDFFGVANENRRFKKMSVTMIDNYDSFTFNLVQYLQELEITVKTHRNDSLSVKDILSESPDFILISPGPSNPDNAGICLDLIKECANQSKPLLGVCLGHQSIAQAFGGKIIKATNCMHGKVSSISHRSTGIFKELKNDLQATRYHSLIVERSSLPDCFTITAETTDKTIMGIRHKSHPIEGVQFHPESVLTHSGHNMLANFAESI